MFTFTIYLSLSGLGRNSFSKTYTETEQISKVLCKKTEEIHNAMLEIYSYSNKLYFSFQHLKILAKF